MDLSLLFNVIFYCLLFSYAVILTVFISAKLNGLKIINLLFLILLTAYLILRCVFIPFKIKDYVALSDLGLYVCSFVLIVVIIILTFLTDKKKNTENTKSVSYAGISLAIAFALSFVKIEVLGGAVTLASALPIIIYSLRFGTKKGVLVGVIFGLLQFIQKPTVYHPMQAILDYPVAFGGIGLAGTVKDVKLFRVKKFLLGATIALFTRYISHVISGYYVFYVFALEGWNPLLYSVVFNLNVLIDLVICMVIGAIIYSSKQLARYLTNEPLTEENNT